MGDTEKPKHTPKPKKECPICKRKVKGLPQHLWDAHKQKDTKK